jgi:hypothetical protein
MNRQNKKHLKIKKRMKTSRRKRRKLKPALERVDLTGKRMPTGDKQTQF